jgi:SAM-dependent methyltransferase
MIDRTLNYGRHHIRRFLQDAAPYETVVDLGAGLGYDLQSAKDVCPASTQIGLEVYPRYRQDLEAKGFKTVAFNLERDPFPFGDESIDVIIANQIMEHVKEIFWIFHEISRTLKIGGRFIVGVPNLASLHCRLMLLAGLQPSIITSASAHVRGWTKRDMLRAIEAGFPGGYAVRGFGGGNFYPFPAPIAKPLAAILPNMAWAFFLSLEKVKPYDGGFVRLPGERQMETPFYVGPHADSEAVSGEDSLVGPVGKDGLG